MRRPRRQAVGAKAAGYRRLCVCVCVCVCLRGYVSGAGLRLQGSVVLLDGPDGAEGFFCHEPHSGRGRLCVPPRLCSLEPFGTLHNGGALPLVCILLLFFLLCLGQTFAILFLGNTRREAER